MPENMIGIKSILTASTMTIGEFLTCILCSVLLGFLISLIYIFTHRKSGYSQSYVLTMTMLPAIIAVIILVIGDSVSSALSLAGAFTLVRFRSAPGDPKDIAYIFFAMAVGLCCGMGYIGCACLFFLLLGIIMFVLNAVHFGAPNVSDMTLKITIPENLDYDGLFDDLFQKYTHSAHLERVKTTNMGTLYELDYRIVLREEPVPKEFLDALRCRNGNLNIVCGKVASKETL